MFYLALNNRQLHKFSIFPLAQLGNLCTKICLKAVPVYNHACIGHRLEHTWFLEIDHVHGMCICVSAPRLLITSGVMWCDLNPM